MGEVPEEAIREAEERPSALAHDHAGIPGREGSLGSHLRQEHGLEVPSTMSPATQDGLHDRLHDERRARDD
jgi:hypothetical protein